MSLLNLIGISDAVAATSASTAHHQSTAAGLLSMLPMLIIFVLVFYFLLVRPQQKRAKEQRNLMEQLAIGDEIVTAGGILGRISKLRDNFVVLTVAKGVEITMQKSSISSHLPKGTIDSMES